MGRPKIFQCLLFRDPRLAQELAPALWAALQEVEILCNLGEMRADFERVVMCDSGVRLGIPVPAVPPPPDLWKSARFKGHIFDQEILAERILEVFGPEEDGVGSLVLITDQEIKPPDGWRYIIWDPVDDGESVAISIAPADPDYWGESDADRIAKIKHRVRTAACCVTGELLRVKRCGNPHCYMYNAVDSVLRLDQMVYFGPEHGVEALSDASFAPGPPEKVAEMRKDRKATKAFWEEAR